MAIARYTLAVDRRGRANTSNGEQTADFIQCVAFDRSAEFAEKYFHQGTKLVVTGRIQTGSYTNKDGQKVYTTDVIVEDQEFAESKSASAGSDNGGYRPAMSQSRPEPASAVASGFMNIPDGVEDVVEGDSALGSVKLSRDAEFQGIMPVRGKILNCLKADYDRIFKSDIITDLIRVLGCGVEVQTKKTKDLSAFDLENLRWNKVIICTDADVDGYQIRTLILTMIYRLCPTLIQEGYVYIAESPLYEITCKDKTWFAYTDAEKSEIVKKLEGKKLSINRSKGLGENDPEMMWMTTMNPATRRLIKVMPEDMARTMQIFDLLLGDNLQGRKEHIAENGYKYLDQLDVS